LPKQAKAPANGTSTDDIVTERFSIAYFAKPDRTASLRPVVDALVPKDTEKFLTAGEFQLMRISGTY
jgi:isopenicillin N synthase-like dioxygenase